MTYAAKRFTLTFIKKEKVIKNVISFYFIKPKAFTYIAGQYLQLNLPHSDPDEHGTSRFFTIASAPEEPFIMITTRLIVGKHHETTFKKALESLQKGDTVQGFGPLGKFYLED